MGAPSLVCLNLAWMGSVDEQMVSRIGSSARAALLWIAEEFCLVGPSFENARISPGELTPRRGLVYDAEGIEVYSPSLLRATEMKAGRTLPASIAEAVLAA